MLSFAVYDESGPASDWSLHHAYVFGNGDVPIQCPVSFENGLIHCDKTTFEASGLALMMDLDGMGSADSLGRMLVRTCLLPPRPEPYLLSLELARRRLMLCLTKLEDWGLFDLPEQDTIMVQLDHARQAFTAAVVAQRQNPGPNGFNLEADHLARRALALALEAGELLALRDAEIDLPKRLNGAFYQQAVDKYAAVHGEQPPVDAPIITPGTTGVALPELPQVGCMVDPSRMDDRLQGAAVDACDFITMPMRWLTMEPTEGKYAFSRTDKWIEWAVRKAKIKVHAGPLVDFRTQSVPDWLYIWENDYETLRDLVVEHVRHLVTRYRRTVSRWTVVSGLHVNNQFKMSLEQMLDLTRVAVMVTRKLHPAGRVEVELTQPWGEYHAANRQSVPPQLYAEMLGQAGINVDALSLRVQFGQPKPGQGARDLMAFSAMLDQYAACERPISISAMGVPSTSLYASEMPTKGVVQVGSEDLTPSPTESRAVLTEQDPGYWRRPWDDALQGEWLSSAMAIALAKPYVRSVCWQELADLPRSSEMASGGLLTSEGQPKPCFNSMCKIRRAVRDRKSPFATAY